MLPGNAIYDYDPNLKSRYVSSWNVGLQRLLTENTVLEARYVGNRSARTWATVNLNEVNVVENGFLTQFQAAQNNLAIANGVTVDQLASLNSLKSTNFFNQGSAGTTERSDHLHGSRECQPIRHSPPMWRKGRRAVWPQVSRATWRR